MNEFDNLEKIGFRGAVFVTVRSQSSRLANKAYLEIKGLPMILHVINRAKRTPDTKMVVVCTTDRPEDDKICQIATDAGVGVFRGSEKDKLARWLGAAKQYSIDYFMTADGDDLFCDPYLNGLGLKQFKEGKGDFIHSSIVVPGAFTYGIRTSALEKACEIKDTDNTEMMSVYFTDTGLFNVEELHGDFETYRGEGFRVTLDYHEDFVFFTKVFNELYDLNPDMPILDIFQYLEQNPDVAKINYFLDEKWSENQEKNTKLIIKQEFNNLIQQGRK
jgi:spore coat polysaccharide biosynthesis protein SpsF